MDKKVLFLTLYSMILADGVVSAEELETFYKLGEAVHVSKDEINKYVVSAGVFSVNPNNLEDKVQVLYWLAIIAWADGNIDETEKQLLKRYVLMYEFEEENADGIVDYLLEKASDMTPFESIINEIKEQ